MSQEKTVRIRELNDAFRRTMLGGRFILTVGIHSLGPDKVGQLVRQVQNFDAFTPDDDPYGEHDFGAIIFDGQKVFWKIDYYDLSLTFGSEDPSDPRVTTRVLTLMRAEEY